MKFVRSDLPHPNSAEEDGYGGGAVKKSATGASTMGILGMLINIPLFSVIYTLLRRYTNREVGRKHIDPHKLR